MIDNGTTKIEQLDINKLLVLQKKLYNCFFFLNLQRPSSANAILLPYVIEYNKKKKKKKENIKRKKEKKKKKKKGQKKTKKGKKRKKDKKK